MAVRTFTNPGDGVIIQPPVYHPFFMAVETSGRKLLTNPLKYENGKYAMDFEDLEEKAKAGARMLILCSPHNPIGRVWTAGELQRLGEICIRNNIIIISDEIHSDIIYRGSSHVPIASISRELEQNSITCTAPSKTFNIAGLSTSAAVIPNTSLKSSFDNMINGLGLSNGNIFGITAMEAAYREGEEWLDQLLEYMEGNVEFMMRFLEENIPQIKAAKPEGTYLVWLDFTGLGMGQDKLKRFLLDEARVALNDGLDFGIEGKGFMRMNIGCPRKLLEEGLARLHNAILSL
jgi:cystathionine beta-lyase